MFNFLNKIRCFFLGHSFNFEFSDEAPITGYIGEIIEYEIYTCRFCNKRNKTLRKKN